MAGGGGGGGGGGPFTSLSAELCLSVQGMSVSSTCGLVPCTVAAKGSVLLAM